MHVVLRISWGSLWRVGVSRPRRSRARPHHAVGWAWRGTWAWTHHSSWRWPWSWGGPRPRCPSHWGIRSGHLSEETGICGSSKYPCEKRQKQELGHEKEAISDNTGLCIHTVVLIENQIIDDYLRSRGAVFNWFTDRSTERKSVANYMSYNCLFWVTEVVPAAECKDCVSLDLGRAKAAHWRWQFFPY